MSDKTFPMSFTVETNYDEMAEAIKDAIHDHDDLVQFVLRLDELIADYDFTLALRDALSVALAEEDAAGTP